MRLAVLLAAAVVIAGCGGEQRPRPAPVSTPAGAGAPAPPDGGMRAGHGGDLEAQFARTLTGRVTVPERDTSPPRALLQLDTGTGKPVVHDSPVRPKRSPEVRLTRPGFVATALILDPDGGTGRIRVSVEYVTRCNGLERQHGKYFPPAQIEVVRIAPGVRVPIQRKRTARLEFPPDCEVAGKAFAEATNAFSLESFSDPVWFRYVPPAP